MTRPAATGRSQADTGAGVPADVIISTPLPRRLRRERRTVAVMIAMHCWAHHGTQGPSGGSGAPGTVPEETPSAFALCPACAALLDYADLRIETCCFGEDKPTCSHCTMHCFRTRERESIRAVMRYAGPRMALRHPYLAARHLLDRRGAPA